MRSGTLHSRYPAVGTYLTETASSDPRHLSPWGLAPAYYQCLDTASLLSQAICMRKDHRPYALKRLLGRFERFWVNHFIRPQLDSMGQHPMVMKPWNLKLYGAGIHFGESIHVITAKDRTVRLTTWAMHQHQGHIELDDYVLLCPGVRIDSASRVRIGASSMLAAGVYITDADWHDLYDRTRAIGTTAPVTLGENVWVGDGSIVCKGVNIGRNSVIGAGSVVASDIPDNVIAAGNPAKVGTFASRGLKINPRNCSRYTY